MTIRKSIFVLACLLQFSLQLMAESDANLFDGGGPVREARHTPMLDLT